MKWDIDTTLKFIALYKSHQCLWNFESEDYKDKAKRDAACLSIVEQMDLKEFGVHDVKNKIKNLRSTYTQEVRKIEDSKKSGDGSYVYVPKIKWLKDMEEVFMSEQKSGISKSAQQTYCESIEDDQDSDSDSLTHFATRFLPSTTTSNSTTNLDCTPLPKRFKSYAEEICARSQSISTEEMAYDMFGRSVALQLKSMSVENGLLAQCKIQNILTEIGIKDHREKTAPKCEILGYNEIIYPHSTEDGEDTVSDSFQS